MTILRSVTASAVAVAMVATSAAPAMAQGYPGNTGYGRPGYGHDGYGPRRHRDRGISAGDVIAGVAVIGVLAAIASAASSKNKRNDPYRGGINSEDEAANACASRAEQRYGGNARATINDVYRTRDGYDVRGTLETDSWRGNRDHYGQRFTCSVRYGQLEDVRFDGNSAWRGY